MARELAGRLRARPDRRQPLAAGRGARRWESPVGHVVGVAALASGVLASASAAAGAITDGRDTATFGILALAYLVVGGALVRVCRVPRRLRSSTAFVGVVAIWLTFVGMSTATYLALDTFAHWDDALFESVAGFTTTAASVAADPESYSRATLLWRAGTQWIGGLTALLFVVAVLPSIGVGGLDVTEAGQRHAGTSLRSRRAVRQLERLTLLYSTLTVAGVVLFLLGGMGPFDSLTYAATTISTGGFGNHRGSFAHFDSATVEWAGFGGMFLGGMNMALLFRAVRRAGATPLWRSFELRAYALVILVGGAVIALATAPPEGLSHDSVRRVYFHVASAASTTGHHVGGWAAWDVGPQVLLLAIIGVGAMSGSAGGGFRLVRALALLGYLRRELVVQLHPRAVTPVRVGSHALGDALVARLIGYQAQYLLVAASGAVAVAVLGGGLVTSLTGAVSALSNMGPALGDLTPGDGSVLSLPRPARAALMPVMLLGRLEIAPVLVGFALLGTIARRQAGDATARLRMRRDRAG